MTVDRKPGPRHAIIACQECGRGMCQTCPENYHVCSGCNAELCDLCCNDQKCGEQA